MLTSVGPDSDVTAGLGDLSKRQTRHNCLGKNCCTNDQRCTSCSWNLNSWMRPSCVHVPTNYCTCSATPCKKQCTLRGDDALLTTTAINSGRNGQFCRMAEGTHKEKVRPQIIAISVPEVYKNAYLLLSRLRLFNCMSIVAISNHHSKSFPPRDLSVRWPLLSTMTYRFFGVPSHRAVALTSYYR